MSPMVDFSQASTFSQLPDEDFLALLQKEFPNGSYDFNGINPQNILNYPLPTMTPPSEDSSPSPPSTQNDSSQSPHADNDESSDPALKRKASDEDLEEGPSSKNQHTMSKDKKASATTTRRKSSGSAPPKDESRLLKRKEQNRAAQRAFRERKEKHVKDLEDKVAALEAKNEQTQTENENLKDLLSRLQTENVLLRSATFTFSMPKAALEGTQFTQSPSTDATLHMFSPSTPSSSTVSPVIASSSRASPKPSFPSTIDWNALTTFDPSMLSMLDEAPQTTASDKSIRLDFGLGDGAGSSSAPYTIANNPTFMSYASMFDSTPTPTNTEPAPFTYDMSNVMSTWSPAPPPNDANTLDELFNGMLGSQTQSVDFNVLMGSSPSLSPVSHHNSINGRSPSDSSSAASPQSASDNQTAGQQHHDGKDCPKSKAELAQAIKNAGESPFAPSTATTAGSIQGDSPFAPSVVPPSSTLRRSADSAHVPMVTCQGSTFPRVEKSDKNIEVLSAWKTIRSNPQFKDVDINDLCSEFTSKAKCDGTKVVLEPQGVHNIIESLKSKAH